jgi:hypothetical protein
MDGRCHARRQHLQSDAGAGPQAAKRAVERQFAMLGLTGSSTSLLNAPSHRPQIEQLAQRNRLLAFREPKKKYKRQEPTAARAQYFTRP